MKNTAFAALVLLLIVFVPACDKAKTSRSYSENIMNGKAWESNHIVAGFIGDKIGLTFQKFKKLDVADVVWDQLSLASLDKQMDKQTLRCVIPDSNYNYDTNPPNASYGVPQDDGDVGCDIFVIHEADSVNNWVEITEQENDFRHIKGRYSMTLIKWLTCDASVTSDTVVIRNGVFDVYLE